MMQKRSRIFVWACCLGLLAGLPAAAQSKTAALTKTSAPDLSRIPSARGWKVYNRTATVMDEGGKKGVRLDARGGDGLAWLENVSFSRGTIELDIRGKDVFQQSFVGIAFHAADSNTFDAIYFRPFNFKATDPARKSHAVQYISHPQYPWDKLRAEHPDQYEHGVEPAPDPTGWFHARVVIDGGEVQVFVNDSKEPSLRVKQLSSRGTGAVALWVGNNSAGDFANLKITPAR